MKAVQNLKFMGSGKDRAEAKQATQASKILNYDSMKFHSGAPQAGYRKVQFSARLARAPDPLDIWRFARLRRAKFHGLD